MTRPDAIAKAAPRLHDWLDAGAHGDMDWMESTRGRRASPSALWPEVKSVAVLGLNYAPDENPLAILAQRERGAISVYAQAATITT